ncbi:MAG: glycosyl transferase family 2 [Desulfobulbus propionicus]|nr:MAG: glycosyl transferase family 2 [Desulfobulbus propionicus]
MSAAAVSVIVPAYNAEKTLDRCLGALSRQTYTKKLTEVIVVDDGSTDSTAAIASKYPVQLISQKNMGPATARNNGAFACTGEIILFTDADCVPMENWVEEMARLFTDKQVAAVKGAYRTRQPHITARFAQIEFEERFDLLEKAGYTDMVDTYSAGYRRSIFVRLGGFDTRFPVANNEDTELSYRMAAQKMTMLFNPKAIVYHLGHPDSVFRYARLKFSRGYWRMIVYRQFPEKMLQDVYTPKSLKIQILLFFLMLGVLPLVFLPADWGKSLFLFTAFWYCCSLLPGLVTIWKKDRVVCLVAPLLLTVRAASLGLGAILGKLRGKL